LAKEKVQCGVCGSETTKFEVETVKPEVKGQTPYERYVGLDCHEE